MQLLSFLLVSLFSVATVLPTFTLARGNTRTQVSNRRNSTTQGRNLKLGDFFRPIFPDNGNKSFLPDWLEKLLAPRNNSRRLVQQLKAIKRGNFKLVPNENQTILERRPNFPFNSTLGELGTTLKSEINAICEATADLVEELNATKTEFCNLVQNSTQSTLVALKTTLKSEIKALGNATAELAEKLNATKTKIIELARNTTQSTLDALETTLKSEIKALRNATAELAEKLNATKTKVIKLAKNITQSTLDEFETELESKIEALRNATAELVERLNDTKTKFVELAKFILKILPSDVNVNGQCHWSVSISRLVSIPRLSVTRHCRSQIEVKS